MTRTVDQAYWRDYVRTHNEERFEDLVARFYARDAVFANPRVQLQGRGQILDFLQRANQDVHIDLQPSGVLIQPGVSAVELNAVMRARKDLPGFFIAPLRQGEETSVPMVSVYHMTAGLIFRARVYWGRCP